MFYFIVRSQSDEEGTLEPITLEKEFSESPTGVEPMIFQVTVWSFHDWAMESHGGWGHILGSYKWHMSCHNGKSQHVLEYD